MATFSDDERAALRESIRAAAKNAVTPYRPNRAARRRQAQGKGAKAARGQKANDRRDALVEAMRRKNEER